MPGIKRQRNHADDFADLEDRIVVDYDPEDDPQNDSSGNEDDGSDQEPLIGRSVDEGREHYARVGKGGLRQEGPEALGPQYSGAKVSRRRATEKESDHDPFDGRSGSEKSDDFDIEEDEDENEDEGQDNASESSDDSQDREDGDEQSDSEGEQGNYLRNGRSEGVPIDREAIRKMMDQENKTLAANLSSANEADAEKGRAVKRQRLFYDGLLNTRIKLQQGLIAMNSLSHVQETGGESERSSQEIEAYAKAEAAALALWNQLDSLRQSMPGSSGIVHKPATAATPLSELRSRMQSTEQRERIQRDAILTKWSKKTASLAQQTTTTTQSRLNPAANVQQPTVVDILKSQHLTDSNLDRLVQRTKIPRSCAPLQVAAGVTESDLIFDDADFYGQLLKELLESRNVDTSSAALVRDNDTGESMTLAAQQAYRVARLSSKVKKNVDTKASKGRKMRYTVHERLQNFMAPENRATWGERQVDELFAGLLGKKVQPVMVDEEASGDEDEVEQALRLFRN